jgi:putrescine transport system ATP-binding protein
MHAGEILQVGSPTDIYEYPTSRFVADFVGSVNLVAGKIVEDEPDHVHIDCPEFGITVYVDHGVSAPPTAEVAVAIRPEKIQITREAPPQAGNVVAGTIKEIAYLGDLSRYLVKLDTGYVVRVTQPNVYRHDERLAWEERVYLHWHPSSIVVVTQ